MLKNKKYLLIFCILCVVSCCPDQDPSLKKPEPKGFWLIKFLEDPVCKPPCWENIVPGKMTMSEAVDILSNVAYIQDVTSYRQNPSEINDIRWKFFDTLDGGQASSRLDRQILDSITFFVMSSQSLTLDEIIASYDSPNYIFSSLEMDVCYCITGLVYESLGMLINIYHRCERSTTWGGESKITINLSEETLIDDIHLTSFDGEWWKASIPKKTVEWRGYGEYLIK